MAVHTGAVVVGYDGSTEGGAAVDWAAAEASRRGKSLVVLHAAAYMQPSVAIAGAAGWLPEVAEEAAQKVAQEGAERARKSATGITVEAKADLRGAPAAMQALSKEAAVVVVGNRGLGRVGGVLLGSVAFAVSAHANSPVVVVRGKSEQLPGPSRPIVVGIDGSESSNGALDRAADFAAETGAELRVAIAWEAPPADPWSNAYLVNTNAHEDAIREERQAATALAEQAADRVSSRQPGLVVQQLVQEGQPEHVLAEASSDAGLVVVGARGRGDLASLLLGSVSRGVIHRSECPVEIVR